MRTFVVATGFVCVALIAGPSSADAPESDDPIKLVVNDWTGQYLTSHMLGGILEHMGYNIEYIQADLLAQFPGLESGDLTISTEIWETVAAESATVSLATGDIVNLGSIGMDGEDFWWYPDYMEELCPGLPDWHALLSEECAKAFSSDETYPKGRFISAPTSWGDDDDQRVAAFGLPFEVVHAGSDMAMFAELQASVSRQDPILIWLWTPHWATAKYSGSRVEFPAHEPECYTDPGWGMYTDVLYDCGKAKGNIWKFAWADGEDKWPMAYSATRKFTVSDDLMNSMIAQVELDKRSADDIVAEWLENESDIWLPWTK